MSVSARAKVAKVISPYGPLTLADLPSPKTQRWSIRRKAEVIAAVRGGLLSLEEACSRYALGVEEYLSWEYCIDRYGPPGLRATLTQFYLANGKRKVAGRACGSETAAPATRVSAPDPENGKHVAIGGLGSGLSNGGTKGPGTEPAGGASTSMNTDCATGFNVGWRAADTAVRAGASVGETWGDVQSSSTTELPLQWD